MTVYNIDYNILNKGEWQTSLCKCDSESCFLSSIVPCHVYAKLRAKTKSEYCLHLFSYCLLYVFIQQLWYSQSYINKNTCPNTLTNTCIILSEDDCNKYYMTIEENEYACIYENGYCVANNYSCIKQSISKKISIDLVIITSISYFVVCYMHYSAREYIKSRQTIDESFIENIVGVVCCPTCGLAQEYREL